MLKSNFKLNLMQRVKSYGDLRSVMFNGDLTLTLILCIPMSHDVNLSIV